MDKLAYLLTLECSHIDILPRGEMLYQHELGVLNVSLGIGNETSHSLTISDITFDLMDDRSVRNIEILRRRDEWRFFPGLKIPSDVLTSHIRLVNVTGHMVKDSDCVQLLRNNGSLCICLFDQDSKSFHRISSHLIIGVTQQQALAQIWVNGL